MKSIMFATLALLGTAAMAGAGGRMADGVSEQLKVAAAGGKVRVTLTASNRATHAVYVPKALYQDDELIAPVFQIRDASGAQVPYIGRKVKRGPITRDDFLAVKPGATQSNTIDITPSYDFRPGEHVYQLSYPGSYLRDLARLDAATPSAVAPVSFTLRK